MDEHGGQESGGHGKPGQPYGRPRVTRDNEIQAWARLIGRGRQVHVQEVRRRNGNIAVFAHTEPEGTSFGHALSALLDGAGSSGGGKVLLNDLRAGFALCDLRRKAEVGTPGRDMTQIPASPTLTFDRAGAY